METEDATGWNWGFSDRCQCSGLIRIQSSITIGDMYLLCESKMKQMMVKTIFS